MSKLEFVSIQASVNKLI